MKEKLTPGLRGKLHFYRPQRYFTPPSKITSAPRPITARLRQSLREPIRRHHDSRKERRRNPSSSTVENYRGSATRETSRFLLNSVRKAGYLWFNTPPVGYFNMVVVAAGTGGAHKVLLISGKHAGSSGGSQTGFTRPISVVLPSAANQASSDSDSNTSAGPPVRKRQRLTHLSPEEKALRRSV